MIKSAMFIAVLLAAATGPSSAAVDALTAEIETQDAQRFAKLFLASQAAGSTPSAGALQMHYLDGAGPGVAIFTPYRIIDAKNLADAVAKRSADYAYAIEHCLPQASSLTAELRSVYLAYQGLLPHRPLPSIHLVFGASNSGGTASAQAQVLGLEVNCQVGTPPATFRETMRMMFAHETVHTWQTEPSKQATQDLLYVALQEGTADYLASLALGRPASPLREAFARPIEAALWQEFEADRQALLARTSDDLSTQPALNTRFRRWFANAGSAPEGRPDELGYWIGMQIAAAYVDRATDKRAAIDELLALKDPPALLKASGYPLQPTKPASPAVPARHR